MTFYETNIHAFAKLIATKPQLFTNVSSTELLHLVNTYQDNLKTLSEAILTWCQNRAPLHQTLTEIRLTFPEPEAFLLGKNLPDKPNGEAACVTLLRNAIQTSLPALTTSQPPQTATATTDSQKNESN
jgi:hypothetical protein